MSDTTKTVDIEINQTGNALASARELRQLYLDMEASRQRLGALPGQSVAQPTLAPSPLEQLRQQSPTLGFQGRAQAFASPSALPGDAARRQLEQINAQQTQRFDRDVRNPPAHPHNTALAGLLTAGAIVEAGRALNKLAGGINTLGNTSLSTSQKIEGIAASIPVLGELSSGITNFWKSMSGVPNIIREKLVNTREHLAANAAADNQRDQLGGEFAAMKARSQALKQLAAAGYQQGSTARTTLLEQVQYGEQQQRLPHQQEIKRAEAEVAAVSAALDAARQQRAGTEKYLRSKQFQQSLDPITGSITQTGMEGAARPGNVPTRPSEPPPPSPLRKHGGFFDQVTGLGRGYDWLNREGNIGHLTDALSVDPLSWAANRMLGGKGPTDGSNALSRNATGRDLGEHVADKTGYNAGDGLAQVTKVTAQLRINSDLTTATARVMEQINRERGLETNLIEKQNALAQAKLGFAKQELDILKQREGTAQSNAQRLGMMSPMQRLMATRSLEMLQKTGMEHAPQFMKDRAAQIAPLTVRNLAEQYGEKTAEFKKLQQLAPGEYRDKLPDIRQQVDKAQAHVGVQINLDAAAMADAISARIGPLIQQIIVKIGEQVANNERRRVADERLRHANVGQGQ